MRRDEPAQCLMAIYDRPRDFPSQIVVRRWSYGADGTLAPAADVLTFDVAQLGQRGATSAARTYCKRLGLRFLPRNGGDDPVLMETWHGRPREVAQAAE